LNFREYVEELIESLFASYTTSTRPDVSLDVAEDPDLPLDQLIGCGIMINELVANALEHGFDDTTLTPELALSFEQIGDDFRLILRDNGRGLPESFDPGRHGNLGWELLESLVQYQLQGEYEITNRDGLEVVVTFPRSVDPNL
jgi:two-component sensor histidine kinase